MINFGLLRFRFANPYLLFSWTRVFLQSSCITDSTNADKYFKDFASDLSNKDYDGALRDLNGALSALSTSVKDCEVEEFKTRMDALAASIKFAKITVVDRF